MNDEYAKRARQVFMELSTLDASAVQGELDRLVGSDRKLREAVISLLDARADADDAGLMTAPTAALPGGMITETVGSVIGPYKVLQTIGEGGFGSVFLAEQSRPVRRRVALKIIKLGMDTKQVIARFEAERQALALMDHPHIARVFDAGSTETGRPFFVMEYVVGDAITTFADAYKLGIRARLALFEQVCSAVQHAHTKGIIHRDLKPANVLVSMVDGKPFAKVIDFGIAKATVAPLTDRTLFTEHRQLIGTPEYMSPEQAEGSPDIDTRTDVYALGVLLYELLTGQTPFEGARLRSAAWAEMQRIIREEEPPAPSLRLSRGIGTLAQTASARGTDPVRLSAAVRGELDWVVMKALDKDRARRYETSAQLAQDIGRHLSGEPVMAAPPSRLYKAKKFVRRNKGAVIAGTAVAAALLIGLIGTAWGWREASLSNTLLRSNSEQISGNLSLMLGHIDPEAMNDGLPTVRIRDGLIGNIRYVPQIDPDGRRRLLPELVDQRRVSVAESRQYARFDTYNLGQLVGMAMENSGALQKANEALRQQTDEAELARMKAEAQRDFAARSGRALLALLNGDEDNADLSYVRSVNASLDQSSEPLDSELIKSDVGVDLKALSAISLDTALKVIEANATLREQADRAREGVGAMNSILQGWDGGPLEGRLANGETLADADPLGWAIDNGLMMAQHLKAERDALRVQADRAREGVGAMLGIFVHGKPGGPLDSFDPETGESQFDADPLGMAIAFGTDLAESLKEERDRLQNHVEIARNGLAEISRVLYSCDCDPQEAPIVGEVAVSAWVEYHGDRFPDESQEELRLRAVMAIAHGNARNLVTTRSEAEWSAYTANLALAQNAMDAGDWPAARAFLAECPDSKRGWEWDFMRGHAESITAEFLDSRNVVSPDGSMILSTQGRWVRLYSAHNRSLIREWRVEDFVEIGFWSFSGDGSIAIARQSVYSTAPTADRTVWLPTDPGREHRILEGALVGINHDGSKIALSTRGGVGIYSSDGTLLATMPGACPYNKGQSIHFGADDEFAVGKTEDGVRIWTLNGASYRNLEASEALGNEYRLSPDGRLIAANTRKGIAVWNARGDLIFEDNRRGSRPDSVCWSSDGSFLVSRLWDAPFLAWSSSGTPLNSLPSSEIGGNLFAYIAPDSSLVATSMRSGIVLTDVLTGDSSRISLPNEGGAPVRFDPDGQSMLIALGNDLRRIDLSGNTLAEGSIDSSDNAWLAGVSDSSVFVYDGMDAGTGGGITALRRPLRFTRQRVRWDRERCAIYAAAVTGGAVGSAREVRLPDGSRTIAADRRTLRFTDTTTGRIVLTLPVEMEVASLALSPEADRLVVTFVDGTLEVLDTRPVEVQQAAIAAENDRRDRVRPLVRGLLESDTPTGELGSRLASHPELSPAERHSAYELLTPRLFDIEREAKNALREITKGAMSTEEGRAAVASAELPERVRARAVELARAWEYTPREPTIDQQLSEETRRRRLAEATLALNEILTWDTPPRHMDEAPIVAALKTRAEILGKHDPLTAQARWLHGTLITFQGRAADGLNLCRQAADDMAADPEADPLLLSGVFYNLVQAELAHGTFEAAETRFRQLLVVLDGLLESDADDALAFRSAGPGEPFRLGYGYEQILRLPLTGNTRFGPDEQRARTRDWVGRARGVGLRGLLIGDSLGYLLIDVGAEEEPYAVVIPNHEARSLIRLFPNEVEVKFAHALSLVRSGDYRDALDMASTAQKEAARSGKRPHAIPVAVQALAAAHLGDEADARSFRDRLQTLKQQPEAERLDPGWSNASGRSMNSDRIIDILLREIDDTLAGRPPMIE